MSALRNDDNLSTADTVNAENTQDTRSRSFEPANPQPQQGNSVAEPEHTQGHLTSTATNTRNLPDLEDTTDPRVQQTGDAVGAKPKAAP